jgi:hypothetical protein
MSELSLAPEPEVSEPTVPEPSVPEHPEVEASVPELSSTEVERAEAASGIEAVAEYVEPTADAVLAEPALTDEDDEDFLVLTHPEDVPDLEPAQGGLSEEAQGVALADAYIGDASDGAMELPWQEEPPAELSTAADPEGSDTRLTPPTHPEGSDTHLTPPTEIAADEAAESAEVPDTAAAMPAPEEYAIPTAEEYPAPELTEAHTAGVAELESPSASTEEPLSADAPPVEHAEDAPSGPPRDLLTLEHLESFLDAIHAVRAERRS